MMQVFRSIAGKVAAAVFAVLMLLFLWTSVDWSQIRGGPRTTVGTINGVDIPNRTFQQLVQNESQSRQRQLGRALTAEESEQTRDGVWDELIQQQSLDREFRARGITASPTEIRQQMDENPIPEFLSRPEFQTDNKFDLGKYRRWLRSSGGAQVVPLLDPQYRDQIRQSKLLRVVTGDIVLSNAALWQTWQDLHETATITLATITPATAIPDTAVTVTEADGQAYYQGHPERFKQPAIAYLSYVEILRITDASDSTLALARVQALRKEIKQGAPFAEVAKRESADSATAAKGGELEPFGRGAMDPAFERAAFSLPPGTVSEPVLSAFGYHLIQVESRAGGKLHARHILIPVELAGQHRDVVDARADSLESIGANQTQPEALDSAAARLGLRVGAANPLQEGSRVQVGLQVIPDAALWAFRAKAGETSGIIEVSWAYFLFRLDSLKPAGVPPFAVVRDAAMGEALLEKKREAARELGQQLAQRLGTGTRLEQAAAALHLPTRQIGPFTRVNPPFPAPRVVGASFGVPAGQTSGLVEEETAFYVLAVVKRESADTAEFRKELDTFRARQITLARQDRVRNYLQALKASAKVTDRRKSIYQTEAQAQAAQHPS